MTDEPMRLEGLFVELDAASSNPQTRIRAALAALGLPAASPEPSPGERRADGAQGVWTLPGKALQDPQIPGRLGIELLAPTGNADPPREGWKIAHALQAELGAASVEPMFAGDRPLSGERGEESLGTPERAPSDVRWHLAAIGVPDAHAWMRHNRRSLGAGVWIGHPDTGYTQHPEIWDGTNERLDPSRGKNFLEAEPPLDPRDYGVARQPGHGTSTASVILARPGVEVPRDHEGGSADLLGIAPDATIVPIRVTKSVVLLGWQQRLARAIEFSVDAGCRVISISLGGVGGRRLRRAVRYAESRGVIVVAAGGNVVQFVVAPASYPTVVACAATGPDDKPWRGSSKGNAITIAAPGHQTWVADWDDARAVARAGSGTSFSTAAVAGAAALWLVARHDELQAIPRSHHAAAFRRALRDTARQVRTLPRRLYGAGMLDVAALVQRGLAAEEQIAPDEIVDSDTGLLDELRAITATSDDESAALDVFDGLDPAEQRELLFHLTVDTAERSAWQEGREPELAEASPRLRAGLRRAREQASPGVSEPHAIAPPATPATQLTAGAESREIVITLDVVIEVET